ncbi:hypothetical protein AB0F43_31400 [Kribbella sp. NPDC023972]
MAPTYPFNADGTGPTAKAAKDPTNPGTAPGSSNLPLLLVPLLGT